MRINSINVFNPNAKTNYLNNKSHQPAAIQFGYGNEEPDDAYQPLTGKGNTGKVLKGMVQVPYILIKEALGIKDKSDENDPAAWLNDDGSNQDIDSIIDVDEDSMYDDDY